MNLVRLHFIIYTIIMGVVGGLVDFLQPYISPTVSRLFCYGKFSITNCAPAVARTELPKRYFKHFYLFAAPMMTVLFLLALYIYFYGGAIPEIVNQLLNLLFGASRKPLVSAEETLICIILMGIHAWKRLYECTYVSVFSDKSINICHYIVAFTHYFGVGMCLVAESEGFVTGSHPIFQWNKITLSHVILAITFLWATYKQYRTNIILANLRKNSKGKVVSTEYKVPYGDLFDYVSAPLQMTEIMLYVTLSIILWNYSVTFHYVTIWVITNQVECALMTHWWYQENLKNYPKKRKIVIPYIF